MKTYKQNRNCIHIFNQGVDRRQIFLIREDYERFKAYLYILNDVESVRPANIIARDGDGKTYSFARGEPLVRVVAFSLLPTHFHLLVEPLRDDGVARFMQKVATGYTMYFNARTIRMGTLFASGYKSHVIERDELKYTRAYIHMTSAQFFHDDWQKATPEELRLFAGKMVTYPYASLQEYHSKTHVITEPYESGINGSGEVHLWVKRPKLWTPAF